MTAQPGPSSRSLPELSASLPRTAEAWRDRLREPIFVRADRPNLERSQTASALVFFPGMPEGIKRAPAADHNDAMTPALPNRCQHL
jgi:hypothetical protein